MADALDQQRMHDIRKSKVRICVTYAMTAAYIVAALGLIFWLMWQQKTDLATGDLFRRRVYDLSDHGLLVRVQRIRAFGSALWIGQ